ncbi:S41 family peptidase [Candidatus Kinetoplastidibacterium desouzai]|uniref:S41 family peptidase n=1 Tax=Candidatus Kinetoplastidibacterium desouzai TaxID=994692 RepID=UPI001F2949C9|nr:S41 family peptidase [Candidatus Kinetoplastibacterium desouzaii]
MSLLITTCCLVIVFFNVRSTILTQNSCSLLSLEQLNQFNKAFSIIKNNYIENIDDDVMINNAISGMLSNLDPHSSYLGDDEYSYIQSVTCGEFGGLGIEVSIDKGILKVISAIEGAPAYKSGILSGDHIIKIGNTLTQGMTLNDSIRMMRGDSGSSVILTISRKGYEKPITFKICRDIIKINSVRGNIIRENILYLRIKHFQEKTVEEILEQLNKITNSSKIFNGLILDLRDNPGGLLSSAVEVSGIFLPQNTLIVSTHGRAINSSYDYFSYSDEYYSMFCKEWRDFLKNTPMIVLVNSGSASASEIVAGAMQDHNRAKILGDRTFGKGSVQTILPLSDSSAIKLTTSRYFTPQGKSIQARGIYPDYRVSDSRQENIFIKREVDLKSHLYNSQEMLLDNNVEDNLYLGDFFDLGNKHDLQLTKAINIISGLQLEEF